MYYVSVFVLFEVKIPWGPTVDETTAEDTTNKAPNQLQFGSIYVDLTDFNGTHIS